MIGQSQHQLKRMQNREILWYGIIAILLAIQTYLLWTLVHFITHINLWIW